MLAKLRALFPIVSEISNENLRDAVLETFADAIQMGGWSLDEINQIPATLLIPDCPISFVEHTNAVTACSIAIAKEMKKIYGDRFQVDFDILIAGGLLHDVGKLLEIERDPSGGWRKSESGQRLRHPLSGLVLAARRNIPEPILHIIACHSKEGDFGKRTTEAIIIHHADFANFEPFRP